MRNNIIFTGIHWAGKWTIWSFFEKKHWFYHLQSWHYMREMINKEWELADKLKEHMLKWELTPFSLYKDILIDMLEETKDKTNLILDWVVRNEETLALFKTLVPDFKVVNFLLNPKEANRRVLLRKIDSKTGQTFPFWYNTNPSNWNVLTQRIDDNEKTLEKRTTDYLEKVVPMVDSLRGEWKVFDIDMNLYHFPNSDEEFSDILNATSNEIRVKLGI